MLFHNMSSSETTGNSSVALTQFFTENSGLQLGIKKFRHSLYPHTPILVRVRFRRLDYGSRLLRPVVLLALLSELTRLASGQRGRLHPGFRRFGRPHRRRISLQCQLGNLHWQDSHLLDLTQNVSPGSTIYTDGLKSFAGLPEAGFKHIPRTQPLRSELRQGAKSAVPLADRAIGNLQQWLIGTYHGVNRAQLQVYLDEFVFRHNRRKQPAAAFQTLLGLGTVRKSTEYLRIRGVLDLADQG